MALDTNEITTAVNWIEATHDSIDIYKVGLEFFLKFGAAGLQELSHHGNFQLFLDLKLHDIPNTVVGAVSSIRRLNPKFLTVHAAGGAAMIQAAANAAPEISITAVTVLTSLDESELRKMGIDSTPLAFATALATNAVLAGAKAIVCSPLEVAVIRELVGPDVVLITPGVRPADSDLEDQSRVMTPRDAMNAGATFIVVGRPITSYFKKSSKAMGERAAEVLESIS